MRATVWCALAVLMFAADVAAADFGTKGGPEPVNTDEIANVPLGEGLLCGPSSTGSRRPRAAVQLGPWKRSFDGAIALEATLSLSESGIATPQCCSCAVGGQGGSLGSR
jgi:hypothetical protein